MPVTTGVDVDAAFQLGKPSFSSVKARWADAAGWLPSAVDRIRSGITPGSGGVVTVTGASGSEQWNITPFRFVLSDGAGGSYRVTVASTKSEAYPTRPGSGLSRYDALVLEPGDTGSASSRYFKIRLYSGAASGSPVLADTLALVPAGAYVLATMLATNGANPTVTQALPRTVAVGGIPPVASQTERDAIAAPYKGLTIYREDLGYHEVNIGTPVSPVWLAVAQGLWTPSTPLLTATTTNPTLGSGSTAVAAFSMSGKTVQYDYWFQFGSTAAAGSGTYLINLPVPPSTRWSNRTVGTGACYDASSGGMMPVTLRVNGTSSQVVMQFPATWPGGAGSNVTHSNLFPWAQSDEIHGTLRYEAA